MANEVTDLFRQIRGLILSARNAAFRSVDTIQVFTNYEVGRLIVEHEQQGARRAGYGERVLKELSRRLADEFGKGFSLTNLKLMRQFYLLNKERIGQTPSDQLTRHGCRRRQVFTFSLLRGIRRPCLFPKDAIRPSDRTGKQKIENGKWVSAVLS